jgi:hypothetical protein
VTYLQALRVLRDRGVTILAYPCGGAVEPMDRIISWVDGSDEADWRAQLHPGSDDLWTHPSGPDDPSPCTLHWIGIRGVPGTTVRGGKA